MKTFALEIITPERVAYKGNAEYITVPAYEGELGVLPGHIDCLALLLPGQVKIRENENLRLFAVSGGFAEIHNKKVIILCETAESAEEIDVERANLSKMRAKENLKKKDNENIAQIHAAIQRASARLKVVSDLQKRKKRKQ